MVPPEIRIQTTFVGADAETVQQSVATPIEEQMSGVDNMNYMYSINANNGVMRMVVNFDVKTDPNIDQMLAQLREAQAASQLPAPVQNYGVTILKSPTTPMLLVALYSPNGTYDATFLANYAYINLVDQITRVKGISNINVFGAGQYAMRFWVKPDQLAKLNLTVSDVISAVSSQNTVNPAGQVGGPPSVPNQEFTYTAIAQGRLVSEQEFGQIVVRENPDGSVVRLADVARVELGAQVYSLAGRLNGQSRRGHGDLPIARLQRPRRRQRRQGPHGGAKKTVSPGPGLRRLPGHHAGRQPRHRGNRDHAMGGVAAGGDRRLYLPPRLAGDAHPAAGGAGVAGRHVCPVPGLRLLHQHALPLRPGARHRVGGG